ncbi:MAG: hypothetical protein A2W25_12035 [candidate division Zixibacteria bacterium RBG_16_53_22]|nr:MAG: hypothetical protein A2W25_12035 [candidate division Zixibacteria bacterium RBG_16_53_22]
MVAASGDDAMCDMCDEFGRGRQSCQDCGKLICFDVRMGDDIIRPAYVTSSGDLFCDWCGAGYDRREEAEADEGLGMWEEYPGDLLAEDVNFDG